VTAEGRAFGLDPGALPGLAATESGVRAASGKALVRIGSADAVIVRRVGEGLAVYLNLLLDSYPAARAKGYGGAAHRALLSQLLGHLGVRPAIQVLDPSGRPAARTRVARYRFGDGEVVAVLPDPVEAEGIRGRDGVTVYEDSKLGKVARVELTVVLPRAAEVTDVRTGQSLGHTDRVTVSAVAGEAVVLGTSSARNSLTVSIEGPSGAARGEHVSYRITSSIAGQRLLRAHVTGPDGSFLPEYAGNVLLEGNEGRFTIPSALSDPPGGYTLKVVDVMTGATAEAGLTLK
jgi:hypothetical protein